MSDIPKLLTAILPEDRIKSRLIDLVSYAADAGFYYLRPKAVVQPLSEEEVVALFRFSHQHAVPMTFRAAGTSLSGQSVSDGILVDLSQYWSLIRAENKGDTVRVQPGAIGAVVNAELRKYGRKIGPDPASINSAMMGGIMSNNASGMCCGVSKNAYHTLKYIRFILPDGKCFSTENSADYARFEKECAALCTEILALRGQIIDDTAIYERIRNKYKTKNTVGYAVNAFIDYTHPLDIFAHTLIGAEGTLGFIAEAVLETVPDYPLKSTALLYFADIYTACRAIVPLTESGAEAVELMDRASLRSIEHIKGVPEIIKSLPEGAAALLVEYQDYTIEKLKAKSHNFLEVAPGLSLLEPPVFTEDPAEQAFLWKVRKGMFPSVGAVRASGSTVILEDIAFPVSRLSDAILDLQQLFKKHRYENAIIFGHAKDGNIHFVVTQAFESEDEIMRYDHFLKDVVNLVVERYNGALKAEHGTGRNMAPFVETEWGEALYAVMKRLKNSVDPRNLLNPGVIINEDKQAHIHHLKELPRVEEEVDKCMECGFCEHKCPSRNLTMTPRRRIVARRELLRLQNKGETVAYKHLLQEYQYDGLDTCAVDGLCAGACPVDINTGSLVKRLRRENHSAFANGMALKVARHFKLTSSLVSVGLGAANLMNRLFGKRAMSRLTKWLRHVLPAVPQWSNQIVASRPFSSYLKQQPDLKGIAANHTSVVYYPTCISRVMGGSADGKASIIDTFMRVSQKAGIGLLIPDDIQGSCCGQIFSSKGFKDAYAYTVNHTISTLWKWTDEGRLPVVLDITSCTATLQECAHALSPENKLRFAKMQLIDSIDYIADFVLPAVEVKNKQAKIALHPVCSLQKMGMEAKFIAIARQLADEVFVPEQAGCCGMAGDRGFLFPELTASATKPEANEVKAAGTFDGYYSSAKTCEMAMSDAVGHNYTSILYLLDACI